jgi:hypothetical protein
VCSRISLRHHVQPETRRRPLGHYLYCAVLCAGIALGQVAAEVGQLNSGFRPFSQAPTRVPYSWDMFSIRIDRCAITWDPPLQIDGEKVSRWADRSWFFEFDTVYNRAATYLGAAARGCRYRGPRETLARLVCVTADGTIHEPSFVCR